MATASSSLPPFPFHASRRVTTRAHSMKDRIRDIFLAALHRNDVDVDLLRVLLTVDSTLVHATNMNPHFGSLDVCSSFSASWPPLFWAVLKGSLPLVRLLLAHGANPHHKCPEDGNTCLLLAVLARKESLIHLLIQEQKVAVNTRNAEGLSPLLAATVLTLAPPLLTVLLRAGADVNAANSRGENPLLVAVHQQDPYRSNRAATVAALHLLLEHGASPNVRDEAGVTPLTRATWERDEGTVQLLLRHGADPYQSDPDGRRPLCHAVTQNSLRLATLLLAYETDSSRSYERRPDGGSSGDEMKEDASGENSTKRGGHCRCSSPLWHAWSIPMVDLLLSHHIPIDSHRHEGADETLLTKSLRRQDVAMVQHLVMKNANMNVGLATALKGVGGSVEEDVSVETVDCFYRMLRYSCQHRRPFRNTPHSQ